MKFIAPSIFLKADDGIISISDISSIDCKEIEQLKVIIHTKQNQSYVATNLNAIEFIMQTRPSSIEGKRFIFNKFSWMIHNLFAHPLMQIFALFKLYKIAFWIHDVTVPTPVGIKTIK